MTRRMLGWMAAGLLATCALPASAGELQLWISYHYQGVESYEAGRYRDANTLFSEAMDESDAGHRLAFTYDGAGMAHAALGEYSSAEEAFNKALCLRERSCGPKSRFIPTTLNNLADLHYIAGDKGKIEPLYRRALELNNDDPYSVEVARSLNGLALVANDAGNYVEAENLLKRAVHVHFNGARSAHPYMATALTNLGALYTNLDRLDEAECALRQARHIQEEVLPCDHPDVAIRLHAEAGWLVKKGCLDEARCAQDKANGIQARFAEINK